MSDTTPDTSDVSRQIYHLSVGTEMARRVPRFECTIEALVQATSRWRAVQVMRAAGVGGFASRDLCQIDAAEIEGAPPLTFEVVVSRPVQTGAWEARPRRGRG